MAKGKPAGKTGAAMIHCPECRRDYPRTTLVRRTESRPGIRRSSGGPTGARTNYFLCCPNGHKVLWLGFRVS